MRTTKQCQASLWLKSLLNIKLLTLRLEALKGETLYETEYFSFEQGCKQGLLWQTQMEKVYFLRTQKSLYFICLHFPKVRIPAVITHKVQLRQAFYNITCKSVPSSLKKPSRTSTFGVVGR